MQGLRLNVFRVNSDGEIDEAFKSMYHFRQYTLVVGLVSYVIDLLDAYFQVGLYAARILRGAKPADLPILQPTRFELADRRPLTSLGGPPRRPISHGISYFPRYDPLYWNKVVPVWASKGSK